MTSEQVAGKQAEAVLNGQVPPALPRAQHMAGVTISSEMQSTVFCCIERSTPVGQARQGPGQGPVSCQ